MITLKQKPLLSTRKNMKKGFLAFGHAWHLYIVVIPEDGR